MKLKKLLAFILLNAVLLVSSVIYAEDTATQTDETQTEAVVMTVSYDDSVTEYTDFGTGWVEAVYLSKTTKVYVTLHANWIAGDTNCNGTVDQDETAGYFQYYRDGSLYGTDSNGRLHMATSGMELVLDLNGYSLDRGLEAEITSGQVFKIDNGAHITIRDTSSDGTGVISGGYNNGMGGAFYLEDGSTLTLESGSICGNKAKNGGAVGISEDCNFHMTGGIIYGNTASSYGGGVYAEKASSISFDEGIIENNTASYGGGIYAKDGSSFTIGELEITGNTATTTGGGLFVTTGSYSIIGTSITGNRAYVSGGGVATSNSSQNLTVGGSVRITENYIQPGDSSDKSTSNLLLNDEGCDLLYASSSPFTDDTVIGITCQYEISDKDKITDGNGNFDIDSYKHFISDDESYITINNDAGSGEGKDRYRVYFADKSLYVPAEITSVTVKEPYACDIEPEIDFENRTLKLTVNPEQTRVFENVTLENVASFTFATENTVIADSSVWMDFVGNSSDIWQVKEPDGSYTLWYIEIVPDGGVWADKQPVASVETDGVTTDYYDFEQLWISICKLNSSGASTLTLYQDWLAGDDNSNGIIDPGETTGDFKYYKNGKEYGTDIGALVCSTNLIIDLNGHTINRGLDEYYGFMSGIGYYGDVFIVNKSIVLKDSSENETGAVKGGGNAAFHIMINSSFTLESGNICENYGNGVSIQDKSVFTMNGGKICNNYGSAVISVVDIDLSNTYANINGGVISGNKTDYDGAAVCVRFKGNAYFHLNIKNTLIENNLAEDCGGVVYVECDSYGSVDGEVFIDISDSIIRNNTAKQGGAIHVEASSLKITDTQITGNRAYNNNGGIRLYGTPLTVGGSIRITDNYVLAKDAVDDTSKVTSNLCLHSDNCDLLYNTSKPFTENALIGVTSKANDNEKISDKNANFADDSYLHFFTDNDNYAIIPKDAGSGEGKNRYQIYYSSKDDLTNLAITSVTLSQFFDCDTPSVIDTENRKVTLVVDNTTSKFLEHFKMSLIASFEFAKNGSTLLNANDYRNLTAGYYKTWRINSGSNNQYALWEIEIVPEGGEWLTASDGAVTVTNNIAARNFPDFESGWVYAIEQSKSSETTVKLNIDWLAGDTNCNGIIDSDETTGTFKYYRNGEEYGTKQGALHLATDGIDMVIDLNGRKIDRGLSYETSNGQVIRLHNGAMLEIKDTSSNETGFITGGNNAVGGNGGAVMIVDSSCLILTSGTIKGNNADYGGAVYIEDSGSFLMNGGKICENTASYGGGIYVENTSYLLSPPKPSLKIYGGEICHNNADNNGGGINFSSQSESSSTVFTVENAKIHNNKANQGGGIYLTAYSAYTSYIQNNAVISQNTASVGGGIYLDDYARMSFTDCKIQDNRAYETGGGVFCGQYSHDAIVGGKTYIYGNYVLADGESTVKSASNIYLEVDSCNLNNNTASPISEGAKIGISTGYTKNTDCFTAGGSKFNADSYKYFVADTKDYIITHKDTGSGDNRYQISTSKKPEFTSVTAILSGETVTVNAYLSGVIGDGIIIFAGYCGDVLEELQLYQWDSLEESCEFSSKVDKVKVMLWKDMASLMPVTEAAETAVTTE